MTFRFWQAPTKTKTLRSSRGGNSFGTPQLNGDQCGLPLVCVAIAFFIGRQYVKLSKS